MRTVSAARQAGFLSTPSARRATCPAGGRLLRRYHFYPRPPRGGRRGIFSAGHNALVISIHALREEGDGSVAGTGTRVMHFYPRPPRGGRLILDTAFFTRAEFLSTPSARRATGLTVGHETLPGKFLSTPSARRATRSLHQGAPAGEISIHALREEGDQRS